MVSSFQPDERHYDAVASRRQRRLDEWVEQVVAVTTATTWRTTPSPPRIIQQSALPSQHKTRNLPSQQDKEYVGAPPAPTHPMKLSIATRKSPATLPALAALRSSSGGCGRNGGRDAGCHSNVMVEIVKSGSSEGREAL